MRASHLIAVDIGNARIKLGLFASDCGTSLPEPLRTLSLSDELPEIEHLEVWLGREARQKLAWQIASVNRPAATQLIDWLVAHRPQDRITMLASDDLPLVVQVERPDMVGIDRLVDAVAVNRMRDSKRAAVIVDVGSAITVDLVSDRGTFMGGAILPGIQMSARALYEFTDLLPLLDMSELNSPPPALGQTTHAAMESGLFWGAVGSIRELVEELRKNSGKSRLRPQIFLTGGAGSKVAALLGDDAQYVPYLTLAGIALSATSSS